MNKCPAPSRPRIERARGLDINQRFCRFRRTTIFDIFRKQSQRTKSEYKQWTNMNNAIIESKKLRNLALIVQR
jgi:hypothetical protein